MQSGEEEVGQGVSGRILNDQGQMVRELRLGSASFCQSWHGNRGMPPAIEGEGERILRND